MPSPPELHARPLSHFANPFGSHGPPSPFLLIRSGVLGEYSGLGGWGWFLWFSLAIVRVGFIFSSAARRARPLGPRRVARWAWSGGPVLMKCSSGAGLGLVSVGAGLRLRLRAGSSAGAESECIC